MINPAERNSPVHPIANSTTGQTTRLSNLIQRANKLSLLNQLLKSSIPSQLADQCVVANIRNRSLVILVSHPAWAARMRTQQTVLLNAAQAAGALVDKLTIKVAKLPMPIEPSNHFSLSANTQAHLRSALASLADT